MEKCLKCKVKTATFRITRYGIRCMECYNESDL